MKISRFDRFLSESHTQTKETFDYIFTDLTDEGFILSVDNMFFSDDEDYGRSVNADQNHRKPGYKISLSKKIIDNKIDLDLAKKTISALEECSGRMSEYGKFTINEIVFYGNEFRVECELIDKESKEAEVNTSDGFDAFISKINRKWSESRNVLTRAFTLERAKDGLALSPKDDSFNSSRLLSTAKTFISNTVRRRAYMGGGPNWIYEYEVNLIDNKIQIIFKERIDETRYY